MPAFLLRGMFEEDGRRGGVRGVANLPDLQEGNELYCCSESGYCINMAATRPRTKSRVQVMVTRLCR